MRSILGRFLEHSRIYRFGRNFETNEYFIGSADVMPRNLDRRVEVIAPITQRSLCARIDEIFDVELAPRTLSWELQGDGSWARQAEIGGVDAQQELIVRAVQRDRSAEPA